MARPDPLKIFLGNLHPEINKPQIHKLMNAVGMMEVVQEILVPKSSGSSGNAGCCFMTFSDAETAADALIVLNGYVEPAIAPQPILVIRRTTMGV